MKAKVLYQFHGVGVLSESDEAKLKTEFKIERLRRHVNNGKLFIEIDFPAEFVEIYPSSRKIKKALGQLLGNEPEILKTQCFNEQGEP